MDDNVGRTSLEHEGEEGDADACDIDADLVELYEVIEYEKATGGSPE